MAKKPIPFDFVLEELSSLNPRTNPMFGCTAIYVGEKIIFILRKKEGGPTEDNGIWLATTGEHHESLKKDFPHMRSIAVFGPGPTGWQVLPEDAADFEESVFRVCEFVKNQDPRIGKVPKAKLRRGKRKEPRPSSSQKSRAKKQKAIKQKQKNPGPLQKKSKARKTKTLKR